VEMNKIKMVETLLEHIDKDEACKLIEEKDKQEKTAWECAIQNGTVEIIQKLIESFRDNNKGKELIKMNVNNSDQDMALEGLEPAMVDSDVDSKINIPALHWSVMRGMDSVFKTFID